MPSMFPAVIVIVIITNIPLLLTDLFRLVQGHGYLVFRGWSAEVL